MAIDQRDAFYRRYVAEPEAPNGYGDDDHDPEREGSDESGRRPHKEHGTEAADGWHERRSMVSGLRRRRVPPVRTVRSFQARP